MRILLTGCTGGYGKAIAELASACGHEILGLARNQESLIQMHKAHYLNQYLMIDFASSNSDNALLIDAIQNFDPQIIINNAGVGSKGNRISNATSEGLLNAFSVNVLAPFELVKIAVAHSSNLQLVVNISSRRGSFTDNARDESSVNCSYSYRNSKSAQNMLSTCLSSDPHLAHIRVVSIHPGKLATSLGVSDASLSPKVSAERLLTLMDNLPLDGDYFSLQEETPQSMSW